MSPDLAFVLTLALRMAITAAFVVTASIITERAGPAIGALIATLPVSGGPSYIFLAIDHGDNFIASSALTSLPINAATILMSLVYVIVAQRFSMIASLCAAIGTWLICALLVRTTGWSLAGGILANVVALAVSLPLAQRFRGAKMPLITRRWYDIPLRAALVATLVATVVTLSGHVGPAISGILALFPVVYTSFILILHPRIGGAATGAVLANGLWGLIGFGAAVVVLHLAPPRFGGAAALSLALATCVAWNLGLWSFGRYRLRKAALSSSSRP